MMIGGEPLALVGQLPFALLGAAAVGLFGRRLGLRPGAATLAALFFLLGPLLLEQIGHVRNDVAGAAVVAVTVAFLAGGSRDGLPGRLTLGMLGIGMMLVTKLALLPAVGAMSLIVLWILIREHRSGRDMRPVWRAFGLGVLLVGLAIAPWWLRNLLREGNPLFPLDLPIIGRGMHGAVPVETRFVPNRLLWPFYPWLEHYGVADGLGGAYAVGIIPGAIAAAFIARRRPLGVVAVLALVSISLWWFLDRREPRFLLGLAGLTFAFIPFALVALQRRWRNRALALLVAASFVTVGAQWLTITPDDKVERLAFYDHMWGTDPYALALPENQGIMVDDRCGSNLGRLLPVVRRRPGAEGGAPGVCRRDDRGDRQDAQAGAAGLRRGDDPAAAVGRAPGTLPRGQVHARARVDHDAGRRPDAADAVPLERSARATGRRRVAEGQRGQAGQEAQEDAGRQPGAQRGPGRQPCTGGQPCTGAPALHRWPAPPRRPPPPAADGPERQTIVSARTSSSNSLAVT